MIVPLSAPIIQTLRMNERRAFDFKAIAVNPIRSDEWFLSDQRGIWSAIIDTGTGTTTSREVKVSRFAGCSDDDGFADGIGGAARFQFVLSLLVTSDGSTLYATHTWNSRLRKIDIRSRLVTTVAGDGQPETRDVVGTG